MIIKQYDKYGKLVLSLDNDSKVREKSKKEKSNPTNKELLETMHLVLEALGVEVE